ncbi:MAG: hypothetical protein AAF772_07835 [Acidobacteriota bacterium]
MMPFRRFVTGALVLVALGAGAASRAQDAQEALPQVAVAVAIEAADFVDGLGDDRAEVEAATALHLASALTTRLPYVRWMPVDASAPAPSDGAGQLRMRLTAVSAGFGDAIDLVFVPAVDGRDAVARQLTPERLYEAFDVQPSFEPLRLAQDLRARIDALAARDTWRQQLHDDLLRHVPLVRRVHLDDAARAIIVPLPFAALPAHEDSRLRVAFRAVRDDGALQDGRIALRPVGAVRGALWPGYLQCRVQTFAFPPIDVDAWDASIVDVLGRVDDGALTVTMEHYVHDLAPTFEDGLASSL